MKTITFSEFENNAKEIAFGVIGSEAICVNCKENGNFVIIDESEYEFMSDALKAIMQAANMDDETYKAVQRLFKAAGLRGDD